MKRLTLFILVSLSLLVSINVRADSAKRIEHSIAAEELISIDFEVSVAEMEVEIYQGDSIEIDLYIEADRDWWIFGRNDVDDVELDIDENGDRLYLRLDNDDIQQEWRVRLPEHLAVTMEVGVGEVEIAEFANNLDLELGVGSFRLLVADIDFESIHIEVGVGDTSIRGFDRGSDNERSFVGADSRYYGDGEYKIAAEVGVGDAEVRKR